MEKGLIINIKQVNMYVNSLKRLRKRFVTNIFNFEELEKGLQVKKIYFEFHEKKYLNLLFEDNGFYRLYFFIVDLDCYCLEPIGKTVVCDVFIMQEDILFEKIKNKLYSCGFAQYDCIGQWVLSSFDTFPVYSSEGFVFEYEKTIEIMGKVLDIFDPYTDYLPDKKNMNKFFEHKNFINAYEKVDHKYVGSLIYTERERMAELEFYFVIEEQRGKGGSYLLHDHFYQLVAKKEYKVISYIHENNLASIAVHHRYGYQKGQLKKYTFINKG